MSTYSIITLSCSILGLISLIIAISAQSDSNLEMLFGLLSIALAASFMVFGAAAIDHNDNLDDKAIDKAEQKCFPNKVENKLWNADNDTLKFLCSGNDQIYSVVQH